MINRIIISIALAGIAAAQSPATPTRYDQWLNQEVTYIITTAEHADFRALASDVERDAFIEAFWKRRGASFKDEHYRRIAYANGRFNTSSDPGWRSARGRVYIVLGPPDEIESHPSQRYEKWRYSSGLLSGAWLEFRNVP